MSNAEHLQLVEKITNGLKIAEREIYPEINGIIYVESL